MRRAYPNTFRAGYEHALKDAYDRLAEGDHHEASFVVGRMHRDGDNIARSVRATYSRTRTGALVPWGGACK